jgi:hypothetical protein
MHEYLKRSLKIVLDRLQEAYTHKLIDCIVITTSDVCVESHVEFDIVYNEFPLLCKEFGLVPTDIHDIYTTPEHLQIAVDAIKNISRKLNFN